MSFACLRLHIIVSPVSFMFLLFTSFYTLRDCRSKRLGHKDEAWRHPVHKKTPRILSEQARACWLIPTASINRSNGTNCINYDTGRKRNLPNKHHATTTVHQQGKTTKSAFLKQRTNSRKTIPEIILKLSPPTFEESRCLRIASRARRRRSQPLGAASALQLRQKTIKAP